MLRALDAARAETEATLARQREFVADASHELRTPLTSVLANLELLAEQLEGERRARPRASALRSSRRMRRLVADLLLLARADAGRAVAPPSRSTSPQVRRRGGRRARAARRARRARPDVDAHEPLVVDGARDELHRLALNLIENALRHTPPGTHVHARRSRARGDDVVLDRRGRRARRSRASCARACSSASCAARGDGGGGSGLGPRDRARGRDLARRHGRARARRPRGARRALPSVPRRRRGAAQTSTTTGSTIGRRLSRS